MHPAHGCGEHVGGQQPRHSMSLLIHNPVAAELHPAIRGAGFLSGGVRQILRCDHAAPVREEQAWRAQPRPRGDHQRQVRCPGDPAGQPGRCSHDAHSRHPGVAMRQEIVPQDLLVQRMAGLGRARVGVRINQPGQHEPAGSESLRVSHRAKADPAVVGPQLHRLAVRQLHSAQMQLHDRQRYVRLNGGGQPFRPQLSHYARDRRAETIGAPHGIAARGGSGELA